MYRRRELTGDERRKLMRALGLAQQLPQQYVQDGRFHFIEDHLSHHHDDPVHARRFSAWFKVSNEKDLIGRETDKKWDDHKDDRHGNDAESFRNHYNVLDQIGSNIIRRK